jgi:hypothetical protein
MSEKSLLFVYNADSGLFSTLTDIAHKVFSPETYQCNLCAITYGNFGIRADWKMFLETLDLPLEFLHRDDFIMRHGSGDTQLPAIFIQNTSELELLISSVEINSCHCTDDLKKLITSKLSDQSHITE